MSDKKHFIQSVFIRLSPSPDNFDATLNYAEGVWHYLNQKGYGNDKAHEPRVSEDWYAKLNANQKRWFDAFWQAFAYNKSKTKAAMRWYQLGDLKPEEYQRIIDAAAKEAKAPRVEGQVRKYAEGWLNEKRYLDYEPAKTNAKAAANLALNHLHSQLASVKLLYEKSQDPALRQQMTQLEHAIANAQLPKH